MKRRILLAAGVFSICLSPAFGHVPVGASVPEINAGDWYNLPGQMKTLSLADLKGRIVMVEFWGTWCMPCRAGIPHLIEMQEKYADQGVVLVAMSDEPKAKLAPFITNQKLPYIVGGNARSTVDAYGIRGFPTMYLVDPEGKVAWVGHPGDAEDVLVELLRKHPAQKKSFFTTSPSSELQIAGDLLKNHKYAEALDLYEKIAARDKGTDSANKAIAEINKLKSDRSIMTRINQSRVMQKGRGLLEAARLLAQRGEIKNAIRYYDMIIKDCADTEYAQLATEERGKLLSAEEKI